MRAGWSSNYMSTNAPHMPVPVLELLLIRCPDNVLVSPVASETTNFYCQH